MTYNQTLKRNDCLSAFILTLLFRLNQTCEKSSVERTGFHAWVKTCSSECNCNSERLQLFSTDVLQIVLPLVGGEVKATLVTVF